MEYIDIISVTKWLWIRSKLLPKEIFDNRKSKTKDPKRKFAVKEYLAEIGRYTRITDLKTQKIMNLENAIGKFGIIDVQLVDFAGSIFLDNSEWEVQTGFNKLFLKNELDNEALLLEHKLKMIRYMRNFQHHEALVELGQILKFGETLDDKFYEFRYICLKGRILMRWRKLNAAKEEFENAFNLLETKFSDDDKTHLVKERATRLKHAFIEPNWDSDIVDYDEIFLKYLYCNLLDWLDEVESMSGIQLILSEALIQADYHKLFFDMINILQLSSDISHKQRDFDKSILNLNEAINLIDNNDLTKFYFFEYHELHMSLIEIYIRRGEDVLALDLIKNLEESHSKIKSLNNYLIYRIKNLQFILTKDYKSSFEVSRKFLDNVNIESTNNKNLNGGISSLYVIKTIHKMVNLGLELKEFKDLKDIEMYNELIRKISEKPEIGEIYINLISIKVRSVKIHLSTNYENEYLELVRAYSELLNIVKEDDLRFSLVIIMYYEFLLNQIENGKDKINDLLNLSLNISDRMLSFPYILVAIKSELIRHIISGTINEFISDLLSMNGVYEIFEIATLIETIKTYQDDNLNMLDLAYNWIKEEIFLGKHEILFETPILQIFNQIKDQI
ncbi:MAG: hypothetical protein GPJ54_12680 [Candidatus Heimdallarchaeota archaeon]|nr:hypothetical protein [Candidatus Heimdallarchaeota archaeon]